MEKIEITLQKYDLYLSFLGRKISFLEDKLNRIIPTQEHKNYISNLPEKVFISPDSISEFKNGWGQKEYDSRGNPYRKMNIEQAAEIRFTVNQSVAKKLTLNLYSEVDFKLAHFLNYEQIMPKVAVRNNMYSINYESNPSFYQHEISLILVCPVTEREKFINNSVVFISLNVN